MRSDRLRRFEIIFRPATNGDPIPLETVADADQATMAFHAQEQRLLREGTPGELVLVNGVAGQGDREVVALLRQPVRSRPLSLLPSAGR